MFGYKLNSPCITPIAIITCGHFMWQYKAAWIATFLLPSTDLWNIICKLKLFGIFMNLAIVNVVFITVQMNYNFGFGIPH